MEAPYKHHSKNSTGTLRLYKCCGLSSMTDLIDYDNVATFKLG